jgi:hypothetical protein
MCSFLCSSFRPREIVCLPACSRGLAHCLALSRLTSSHSLRGAGCPHSGLISKTNHQVVVSVPALKSGPPQCTSVLLQFLMLLSVVSLPASRSGPPQGTTPRVTTLRTGNKLMSCDTDATDVGARARSLTSLASLAPPFLSLSPPENEPATW